MQPNVVADVGNSRIKWGRCLGDRVGEIVSLPPDDLPAWWQQLEAWERHRPAIWAIAGVHPAQCLQLAEWLRSRGKQVSLLDRAAQLPLQVQLDQPDRVGIDRLLNAVAVNTRRRPGYSAAIIDAGSAVTVDFLDGGGSFRGGAIFPGLRLMAKALHDHTALLPLVQVKEPAPLPGPSTSAAIQGGVYWAVVGGVEAILRQLRTHHGEMDVYLTGGDASVLAPNLATSHSVWPEMTLEGIRLSALASLPSR
jgi:type III pantothenate kinase